MRSIGEPGGASAEGHDLEQEKAAARRLARERRKSAARDTNAGLLLAEQVFEVLTLGGDEPVSGYWPIGSEIDIRPCLDRFARRGHLICLPVVVAKATPLLFRSWHPGDPLVEAGFGTSVPAEGCPEVIPRVMLVPLLGFDRDGYRLGYGGGFYDRTIAGLRSAASVLAIGVAFAAQEMPSVPRDRYDQQLDLIVTEREAIKIRDLSKI